MWKHLDWIFGRTCVGLQPPPKMIMEMHYPWILLPRSSWAYLSEMDVSKLCWFPLGYRKLTRLSFVPHLPGGRRQTVAGLPGQNPPGCEDLWQQPDQGPTDWRRLAAQIGCASQLVKGKSNITQQPTQMQDIPHLYLVRLKLGFTPQVTITIGDDLYHPPRQ